MSLDRLPKAIRELNQWVCASDDNKIPMQSQIQLPASSTNPITWSDFETARNSVEQRFYDYVGFVFNNNGIIGIDIDKGYDDDGFLSPLACDIIGKCKSYTEKSKSGRGFHILLKGDIPFKGKNNLNGVEIYKQSRFFIMTGDVLRYDTIIENQDAVDYIIDKYFPETRTTNPDKPLSNKIYTPTWEKPTGDGKIRLQPIYNRIPDGTRNISLTSLAGQWHNIGYSSEDIYRELLYVNATACAPPLDNNEILSIVNSVTKYKR